MGKSTIWLQQITWNTQARMKEYKIHSGLNQSVACWESEVSVSDTESPLQSSLPLFPRLHRGSRWAQDPLLLPDHTIHSLRVQPTMCFKKKKKRKLFKADLNWNAYWHTKILLWEGKNEGRKEGRGEGRWEGGPPTVKTLVVRGVIWNLWATQDRDYKPSPCIPSTQDNVLTQQEMDKHLFTELHWCEYNK